MNRLTKELKDRRIIFSSTEEETARTGIEHCQAFVAIERDFLICRYEANVIPTVLRIYDRRTLKPIGEQDFEKDRMWNNHWSSIGYVKEDGQ